MVAIGGSDGNSGRYWLSVMVVAAVATATAALQSHSKLGRAKLKKTTIILVLHMSIKPQQKESKRASSFMPWHGIEKQDDEVGVNGRKRELKHTHCNIYMCLYQLARWATRKKRTYFSVITECEFSTNSIPFKESTDCSYCSFILIFNVYNIFVPKSSLCSDYVPCNRIASTFVMCHITVLSSSLSYFIIFFPSCACVCVKFD